MTYESEIQKLEPDAEITLFELNLSEFGGGVLRFHGHTSGNIVWQGNTYAPAPVRATGFARTSEQQPQPKLTVGNVDGAISQLCLLYQDLVGAELTRHRTFAKFLDGEAEADPDQERAETWIIERKTAENKLVVEWELASALEFGNVTLPRRVILSNYCPPQWVYRGENCNYSGPPVATILDEPTSDPGLDRCGKRLASCKLRQWPDNQLGFGGFPAAGLVRT